MQHQSVMEYIISCPYLENFYDTWTDNRPYVAIDRAGLEMWAGFLAFSGWVVGGLKFWSMKLWSMV